MQRPSNLLWARAAALAAYLAVAALVVRVGVYEWATDPGVRDGSYVAGSVDGLGVNLLLGALCAAPLLFGSASGVVVSALFSVIVLLGDAAGAHYHAIFQNLPTRETLAYLKDIAALASSVREHAPLSLVFCEALFPAAACHWLARRSAKTVAALLEHSSRRRIAMSVAVTLAAASTWSVGTHRGQRYYGAVGPWLYAATHRGTVEVEATASDATPTTRLAAFRRDLGSDDPGGGDSDFPFCAPPTTVHPTPNQKSVIFLILESVDMRSYGLYAGDKPVMPNLRRLASDGLLYTRFFSTGNKSQYALPALFGGVPVVPSRPILLRSPMPTMEGFPAELDRLGYRTAYFHGADLSFENQRDFLKRVGFDEIHEPSPLSNEPRYGWGVPDGALFDQIRAFVEERRKSSSGPFFASAFTLSTHDPYTLPPDRPSRFHVGASPFDLFMESLGYLDDELGRFYEWYQKEEAPRGTLFVITGDHAPRVPLPGDPTDTTTGEFEYRFNVPLVVVGLDPAVAASVKKNADACVGSHYDVPATLAAALGIDAPRCHFGRNLLDPAKPPHRFVTSSAGESLDFLYAADNRRRYMLELSSGRLTEFDWVKDTTFRHDLAETDPRARGAKAFLWNYAATMNELVNHDRLAPKTESRSAARPALPRVTSPLIAAECTASNPLLAPSADPLARFDRTIADGAKWIALEINVTREGIPAVYPAEASPDATGRGPGMPMTLEALRSASAGGIPTLDDVVKRVAGRAGLILALGPRRYMEDELALSRNTLRLLPAATPRDALIVSTASTMMRETLRQFSTWPIGAEQKNEPLDAGWLDRIENESTPVDWVSLDARAATPDHVKQAHDRGLRVILRNATRERIDAFQSNLPDAIVTTDFASFRGFTPR